jgi:hypothetical protein
VESNLRARVTVSLVVPAPQPLRLELDFPAVAWSDRTSERSDGIAGFDFGSARWVLGSRVLATAARMTAGVAVLRVRAHETPRAATTGCKDGASRLSDRHRCLHAFRAVVALQRQCGREPHRARYERYSDEKVGLCLISESSAGSLGSASCDVAGAGPTSAQATAPSRCRPLGRFQAMPRMEPTARQ